MNERETEELVARAQVGATIREFCRHPGFAMLMKYIQVKVADSRNEWLSAPSPARAEEIRLSAKPYAEIEAYLKKLMIEGDVAAHKLTEAAKEDLQ